MAIFCAGPLARTGGFNPSLYTGACLAPSSSPHPLSFLAPCPLPPLWFFIPTSFSYFLFPRLVTGPFIVRLHVIPSPSTRTRSSPRASQPKKAPSQRRPRTWYALARDFDPAIFSKQCISISLARPSLDFPALAVKFFNPSMPWTHLPHHRLLLYRFTRSKPHALIRRETR